MADAATRFRIEAIVRGLENVEALKNSVKRLQSTASPAAADLNKLKDAAVALGSATDRTENDLRTAVAVLKDLRANVALNDAEFRKLTTTIGRYEQQLNRANGTGGRFDKLGQTVGAVAASGVFGGPEGLLGAGVGALFGPAGALAGGAIGAQVGQVRLLIGETATYASEISKLNIALKSVAGSQNEYLMAQMAINRAVEDFNVPIQEATRGFTRLSASVIGAGGKVSDAEKVFRGVSAAVKATGGSAEDVQAALTAMAQVFGKGKVSAEELQGQLGERLPGAVTKFAEATGRTLPQLAKDLEQGTVGLNDLMKFVEALGREYEGTAKRIADSQDESGARMKVSLDKLRQSIGETFKPIGSALQDSIATLADKTVIAVGLIVGVFKDLKAAFDNISIGLPKVLTDIINQMPGFIARLTPIVGQLSFILDAAVKLRGQDPSTSGMYGRYGAPASQSAISQPTTQFADPTGGKGDLDRKALEKAENERVRLATELNSLEQQRIKAYFDQLRAGQDQLTQLQLQRDELWYITRLRLQEAAIDKGNIASFQARVTAIQQQFSAEKAAIDARRQDILETFDQLNKSSKELNDSLFAGFKQKTGLEAAYEKIDGQISNAITKQDELLKKLRDAGGLNPETEATRNSIGARRQALLDLTPAQRLGMASRELAGDEVTALQKQITALQNTGRELTTLDQLKQKYLADWDKLDPELRAQLETLAKQKDILTEQVDVATKLKDAVVNPLREGLTQAFDLLVTGTENWGNSLRNIAATVLRDIAKQLLQIYVINQLINGISKLFPTGGGGGGFLSGTNALSTTTLTPGGVFANGGTFANGIKPFASGGIVTRPTMFKFANGGAMNTGLMGEAGPEAIIPLKRGADGKLGVAGGGGSTSVTVNVDASGSQVQGDSAKGEELGRAISQAVQAELIKQKRPGGLLAA